MNVRLVLGNVMNEKYIKIALLCLILTFFSLLVYLPVLKRNESKPKTSEVSDSMASIVRWAEDKSVNAQKEFFSHFRSFKASVLLFLSKNKHYSNTRVLWIASDSIFLLLINLLIRKNRILYPQLSSIGRRFSLLMAIRLLFRGFITLFSEDRQIFPYFELLMSLSIASVYVHVRGIFVTLFSVVSINMLFLYARRELFIDTKQHDPFWKPEQNLETDILDLVPRLELGNHQPPLRMLKSPERAYGASLSLGMGLGSLLYNRYNRAIERRELNWVRFANISVNHFEAIPGVFSDFRQLQWLEATDNPIFLLEISSLPPSLIGLSLSNCKLIIAHWDKNTICTLRYLNLSTNALSMLPSEPLEAPFLEVIDLSGNLDLNVVVEDFILQMPNLELIILPNGDRYYPKGNREIPISQLTTADAICRHLNQFYHIAQDPLADHLLVNQDFQDLFQAKAKFIQLLFIALIFQPLLFGIFFDPVSIARPMSQTIPIKFPMLSQLQLLRRLPRWKHGFVLPFILGTTAWFSAWYSVRFKAYYSLSINSYQEELLSISLSILIAGILLGWSFLYRNTKLYAMQAFTPAISKNDYFATSVALENSLSVVLDIVDLQYTKLSEEAFIEYCSIRIWIPFGKSNANNLCATPATHSLKLGKSGLSTSQMVEEALLRFGPNKKKIEIAFWPFFWNLILIPSNFFFLFVSGFEAVIDCSSIDGLKNVLSFIRPTIIFGFPIFTRAFMEIWVHSSKYDVIAMVLDLYRFIPLDSTKILVKRQGNHEKYISHSELLPGDLVFITMAGIIPADMLILEGQAVISEAMLTGESVPVQKIAAPTEILNAILGGRKSNIDEISKYVLYDGTFMQAISSESSCVRRIKAIVLATGFSTRKGSIIQTIRIGTRRAFSTSSNAQLSIIASTIAIVSIASIYLKEFLFKIGDYILDMLIDLYKVNIGNRFDKYLSVVELEDYGESATLFKHSSSEHSIWTLFSSSLLAVGRGKIYLASYFEFTHHIAMKLFSMTDESHLFSGNAKKSKKPISNGMEIECTDLSKLELAASIDICCFDKTGTLTESEMKYVGWLDPSQKVSLSDGRLSELRNSFLRSFFSRISKFWDKKIPTSPTQQSDAKERDSFNNGKLRLKKYPGGSDVASNARLVIGVCHTLFEAASLDGSGFEIFGSSMEKLPFEAIGWELYPSGSAGEHVKTKVVTDDGITIEILKIFPKDSLRKRMVVIGKIGFQYFVAMKGASDILLPQFRWSCDQDRISYLQQSMALGSSGYRIMALGLKWLPSRTNVEDFDDDEEDDQFTFSSITDPFVAEGLIGVDGDPLFSYLGMVAFESAPKNASLATLKLLRESGHQTVMITGDSMETAAAVGHRLEFFKENSIFSVDIEAHNIDHGSQIRLSVKCNLGSFGSKNGRDDDYLIELMNTAELLTPHQLYRRLSRNSRLILSNSAFSALIEWNEAFFVKNILPKVSVFARSTPDNKCLVLRLYKQQGLNTLMCGDGTNDIMALQQADIGVALLDSPQFISDGIFERPKNTDESAFQDFMDIPRKPFWLLKKISQTTTDFAVVAPFTSYVLDISCVTKILRLGRASAYYRYRLFLVFFIVSFLSAVVQVLWGLSFLNENSIFLLISFGLGSFSWDMMPGFFRLLASISSLVNLVLMLIRIAFNFASGTLIAMLRTINPMLANLALKLSNYILDLFSHVQRKFKELRQYGDNKKKRNPDSKNFPEGENIGVYGFYTPLLLERPPVSIMNLRSILIGTTQVLWHLFVLQYYIRAELSSMFDSSDGIFLLKVPLSYLSFFIVLSVIFTNYSGRPYVLPIYYNTPLISIIIFQILYMMYIIYFQSGLSNSKIKRLLFIALVDIVGPLVMLVIFTFISIFIAYLNWIILACLIIFSVITVNKQR